MILRETVVYLKHRTISWVPSLKTPKAGRRTITFCIRPPKAGGRRNRAVILIKPKPDLLHRSETVEAAVANARNFLRRLAFDPQPLMCVLNAIVWPIRSGLAPASGPCGIRQRNILTGDFHVR